VTYVHINFVRTGDDVVDLQLAHLQFSGWFDIVIKEVSTKQTWKSLISEKISIRFFFHASLPLVGAPRDWGINLV
jgi:hypothetical protein